MAGLLSTVGAPAWLGEHGGGGGEIYFRAGGPLTKSGGRVPPTPQNVQVGQKV